MLLTSYPPSRTGHDIYNSATIWQAARATTAASTFFEPIRIGRQNQEFLDGGTGANNPIEYLWSEAQSLCLQGSPLETSLDCLVSVGTGVSDSEEFGDDLKALAKTIIQIASQTKETAIRFHNTHPGLAKADKYFRFDAREGLRKIGFWESEKTTNVKDLTDAYLNDPETYDKLKRCGSVFRGARTGAQGHTLHETEQCR